MSPWTLLILGWYVKQMNISKICGLPKETNLLKFNQTKHLPFPKPQNNSPSANQPEDPGPLSQSSNPKTDAAEAPDATELEVFLLQVVARIVTGWAPFG